MPVGSHLVSAARAVLEVDLGPLREGLAQGKIEIHRFGSTGAKSLDQLTGAELRAARAQERLTLEQRRYAGEANHSVTSTLRLRAAEEKLALATANSHRGFTLFGRTLGTHESQVNRAARAHGNLEKTHASLTRRVGRGVGFLGAAGFGAGIGFGVEQVLSGSIKAAAEDEAAQRSLRAQLQATGISYAQNRGEITKTIEKQGELSGFTSHELLGSFTSLVRRTGDVNQALKLNGVAADIARAKHISLSTASTLLIRALAGNARAATTLQLPMIQVTSHMDKLRASGQRLTHDQIARAKALDKEATGWAIAAAAQSSYRKQAAANVTPQERLNRALHETEVTIGRELSPTVNRLSNRLAAYLNRLNRTGRLQRDVKVAMHDAGVAAHLLGDGFHAVNAVVSPLNHLLGGTERTVKLLGGAFAGLKLLSIARGLGLVSRETRAVGLSAFTATGEVDAFKTAEERPDGSGGGRGRGRGRGRGSRGPGVLDVIVASTLAPWAFGKGEALGRFVFGDGKGEATGFKNPDDPKNRFDLFANPNVVFVERSDGSVDALIGGKVVASWAASDQSIMAQAARSRAVLAPGNQKQVAQAAYRAHLPGAKTRTPTKTPAAARAGKTGPAASIVDDTGALVIPYDIRLALAQNPDDVKALERERNFIRRAIREKKVKGDNLIQAIDDARAIDEQLAAKLKDRTDTATALRQKHAREAAAAARRHAAEVHREARVAERRREGGVLDEIRRFSRLLVRAPSDDARIKLLKAEDKYFDGLQKHKELSLAFRRRLDTKDIAVEKQLKALRDKKRQRAAQALNDNAAVGRGLASTLNEIIRNESNVTVGPTIVQHLHFPHPPTRDGLREAQVAHFAAQASFA
jgi:hypothetical protein